MKETAKFSGGLQSIINAFSVHGKPRYYFLKTLDEAISLVSSFDEILYKNVEIINSINGDDLSNSLNGPEGSVSAVTLCSINMLLWGLKKLKENCESFSYTEVNLLSCMRLSVTLVSYAQDFATTIKESIKEVTKWSVHYFTSRERWCPLSDSTVSLASLQFPKRTKNLSGKTPNSDQKREMREWASVNGAVVRQRSCQLSTGDNDGKSRSPSGKRIF